MSERYTPYETLLMETTLSFMESHPYFARKQITELGLLGDDTYYGLWIDLSKLLNALGVHKTLKQWQDDWTKLRLENKQLMSKYLQNEARTGNLPNDIELSEFDIRISNIFGKYGTGLAMIGEAGIKSSENINALDLFDEVITGSTRVKGSAKGNRKSQSEGNKLTTIEELELIDYMSDHYLYACDKEEDEETVIIVDNQLLEKMNSLGRIKRLTYWKNAWVNIWRTGKRVQCNISNEFVDLVAEFMKTDPRYSLKRDAALKKLKDRLQQMKLAAKSVEDESESKSVKIERGSSLNIVDNQRASTSGFSKVKVEVKAEPQNDLIDLISDDEDSKTVVKKPKVLSGDKIDVEVLESIIQSEMNVMLAKKLPPKVTVAVKSAVNSIMESPRFLKRLKDLLIQDIRVDVQSFMDEQMKKTEATKSDIFESDTENEQIQDSETDKVDRRSPLQELSNRLAPSYKKSPASYLNSGVDEDDNENEPAGDEQPFHKVESSSNYKFTREDLSRFEKNYSKIKPLHFYRQG